MKNHAEIERLKSLRDKEIALKKEHDMKELLEENQKKEDAAKEKIKKLQKEKDAIKAKKNEEY